MHGVTAHNAIAWIDRRCYLVGSLDGEAPRGMVGHRGLKMDPLIIGIGALLGIGALALVYKFVTRNKTGRGENNPQDDIYPMW